MIAVDFRGLHFSTYHNDHIFVDFPDAENVYAGFAKLVNAKTMKMFPALPDNDKTYFYIDRAPTEFPAFESGSFIGAELVYMSVRLRKPFSVSSWTAYQVIQHLVACAGGPAMDVFVAGGGTMVNDDNLSNLAVSYDGKKITIFAGKYTGRVIGQKGQRINKIKSWFDCPVIVK